jgi:hypothetical protein
MDLERLTSDRHRGSARAEADAMNESCKIVTDYRRADDESIKFFPRD